MVLMRNSLMYNLYLTRYEGADVQAEPPTTSRQRDPIPHNKTFDSQITSRYFHQRKGIPKNYMSIIS